MKINDKLTGILLEINKTKTDKPYAVIYTKGETVRVYNPSEGLIANIGKQVTLTVEGFAKEVYLKQVQ